MRPYFTILALLVCLSVKGMDGTFGNMTAGSATAQTSFTSTGGTTNLNANVVGTNTSNGSRWMLGTNSHMWMVDKFGTKFTFFTNHISVVWTNGAYGYWTNNGDGTCDMWVNGKLHGNGSLLTGLPSQTTYNLSASTNMSAVSMTGLVTNRISSPSITNSANIQTATLNSTGLMITSGGLNSAGNVQLQNSSLVGDTLGNNRTIGWLGSSGGGGFYGSANGGVVMNSNLYVMNITVSTNGSTFPTNFSATAFAPVAGLTKLIGSNNAVYVVGTGYTNVVVADH